jgi:hypothetical protein
MKHSKIGTLYICIVKKMCIQYAYKKNMYITIFSMNINIKRPNQSKSIVK